MSWQLSTQLYQTKYPYPTSIPLKFNEIKGVPTKTRAFQSDVTLDNPVSSQKSWLCFYFSSNMSDTVQTPPPIIDAASKPDEQRIHEHIEERLPGLYTECCCFSLKEVHRKSPWALFSSIFLHKTLCLFWSVGTVSWPHSGKYRLIPPDSRGNASMYQIVVNQKVPSQFHISSNSHSVGLTFFNHLWSLDTFYFSYKERF